MMCSCVLVARNRSQAWSLSENPQAFRHIGDDHMFVGLQAHCWRSNGYWVVKALGCRLRRFRRRNHRALDTNLAGLVFDAFGPCPAVIDAREERNRLRM